jgi:hypothetical protein
LSRRALTAALVAAVVSGLALAVLFATRSSARASTPPTRQGSDLVWLAATSPAVHWALVLGLRWLPELLPSVPHAHEERS